MLRILFEIQHNHKNSVFLLDGITTGTGHQKEEELGGMTM